MKLLSVSLARLTVLTDPAELNPRNQVSLPDFIRAITERYGFLKFPKAIEEFDAAKGISFGMGKIGGVNIESVILYGVGVVIETRSSTKDCEVILGDLIEWAQNLVGVEYNPIRPPRKYFISELSFQSDLKMEFLNKSFASLSARVGAIFSSYAQQQFDFETIAVLSLPDLSNVKIGPSSFRIDRLANSPFEEKKFFSSAPIPTEDHIQLLEEFERALLG